MKRQKARRRKPGTDVYDDILGFPYDMIRLAPYNSGSDTGGINVKTLVRKVRRKLKRR